MTKLYRVIAYVQDFNGNSETKEDVIRQIENNRYPEFIDVQEVLETDLGEVDDDHELNQGPDMTTYDKYFPEIHVDTNEKYETLKRHFRAMRTELINERQKMGELEYEMEGLKEDLKAFKKIQEFLKNIDELRR